MFRHRRRDVTLPFGPYLAAGAALALVLAAG
jgi:prepilin signal peptidase PulO-like enzyme (type II secretory pathway)